jgi:hypothetical protein
MGATGSQASSWVGVQQAVEMQNYINYTPVLGAYQQSRALILPFQATDTIGSATVATLINTPDSQGGWMPSWECNQ